MKALTATILTVAINAAVKIATEVISANTKSE